MTLRFDNHGRPRGLNWTVCNDGNPRPEVWGINALQPRRKKPGSKRREIMNPGVGRGGVQKFSDEKDALIVKMYLEDKLPAYKIAKAINSTPKTIWRVLKRNDVQKRTQSHVQKLRHKNERLYAS